MGGLCVKSVDVGRYHGVRSGINDFLMLHRRLVLDCGKREM